LFDGLAVITPGFCPRVRPAFRERLQIAASRFGNPSKLFPIPLNDPELFTANPERQQFIATDPLALGEATARLLFESARLDIYLKLAMRRVAIPTLVLLAERDRIIDNTKTRAFVKRFPTPDLTVKEYSGAHHTLEFEPGGPVFVDDVVNWLKVRF
jgi:alpha-beta hydrolase superfamily lysophospholipase